MAGTCPGDLDITIGRSPEEVAAVSDVLSVHLALANETRNMVGASILGRLEPGSYFVNTSRGEIVDHMALAEVVRTRNIRVALDVFAREPPTAVGAFDDPLMGLPGVIGTIAYR